MPQAQGKLSRSLPGRMLIRLDWLIGWIENIVLSGAILLMAALNIANVLGDNLLKQGLPFAGEINQALLVMITFVGVAKAARHGRNIRMSAIYDQLKGRWRKGLNILITTGSAVVMFYLAYYAVLYEAQVRSIGQATPSLGIPIWTLYVLVPVGLFMAGLQYTLTTVRNLVSKELYRSFLEKETYEDADLYAEEEGKLLEDDDTASAGKSDKEAR
ncbi:TRAP transporter small permease [Guyparkeria hydrothermalis]|uniref:TRAP transporter small permease n=1 Tax=Guyparkeria hydrothermalis TaxID=923 RepID=UPI0020220C95|nr:TRAP transporter small permease [Guyparkeria hydrothermalis]MCL7744730.1 TRAP transporter small permease [Guyparkeria hydrothermalis]